MPEAPQQLRSQADFRHQHQRLATLLQHRFKQPEIDLGLATAGHAIQQVTTEATKIGHDRGHRLVLIAGQCRSRNGASLVRRCRLARNPVLLDQGGQGLAPLAANRGKRLRPAWAGGQNSQHLVLNRRPPRRLLQTFAARCGQVIVLRSGGQPGRRVAQRRRQGADHDLPGGVLVVLPAPAQQIQQAFIQQGHAIIQDLDDRQQPSGGYFADRR